MHHDVWGVLKNPVVNTMLYPGIGLDTNLLAQKKNCFKAWLTLNSVTDNGKSFFITNSQITNLQSVRRYSRTSWVTQHNNPSKNTAVKRMRNVPHFNLLPKMKILPRIFKTIFIKLTGNGNKKKGPFRSS